MKPICIVCLEEHSGDEEGLSFCCNICDRCGFCNFCAKPENHDCEPEQADSADSMKLNAEVREGLNKMYDRGCRWT